LGGLLDLREAFRTIGITDGFQWINGSFVEDTETNRFRPPDDIDVVTLANRPDPDPVAWRHLVRTNIKLFDPDLTKASFGCDAYFIDLLKKSDIVVADVTYFFGLFSHQRNTGTWNGMVRVPLRSDDQVARGLL
jgi:hypothetical protein